MKDIDDIKTLEELRQYAISGVGYILLQLEMEDLESDLHETRLDICAQSLSNLGTKMKDKLRKNLY